MKVLITGAAGRIGAALAWGLAERFDLMLTDIRPLEDVPPNTSFFIRDITVSGALDDLLAEASAVVHLAGHPNSSDWDVVTALNVAGSRRLFEAAAGAGVERVLYASSIHVVGLHPAATFLGDDLAPRPDSPYGVSKLMGEQLLEYFCGAFGMSGFALRFCSFRPRPSNARELRTWISPGDAVRLVEATLTVRMKGFHRIWGLSNNRRAQVDRETWRCVGYFPADDAEAHAERLAAEGVDTSVTSEWPCLGGQFVPTDFGRMGRR